MKYTLIIGGLLIIIAVLILDEYCVINIINSPCEVQLISERDSIKGELDTLILSIGDFCNNKDRFPTPAATDGGGDVVDASTQAMTAIHDFWNYLNLISHSGPTTQPIAPTNKGVYFSKKAFDRIFDDNPTANGVVCYFALKNNKFNIVMDAVNSDYGNYNLLLPSHTPTGFKPVFIANDGSMCPDDCGDNIGTLLQ